MDTDTRELGVAREKLMGVGERETYVILYVNCLKPEPGKQPSPVDFDVSNL